MVVRIGLFSIYSKPNHRASLYCSTSFVAELSFFFSAIDALNSSSCVVIIFSMAELACASCKLIVSIKSVELGKLVIAPFSFDNALLAAIVFFSIALPLFPLVVAIEVIHYMVFQNCRLLFYLFYTVLNEGIYYF